MKVERLLELVNYNPVTGVMTDKKTGNTLYPSSFDKLISVRDPVTKKVSKFKPAKLAYSLLFKVDLTKTDRVIHRNLNEEDNSAHNLLLVDMQLNREIKEAWKNIQGGIRLVAHPTDSYAYKLHWFEGGAEKTKVVQDVVVGKRLEQKLLLRYSKILTKYCNSSD